MERNDDQVLPPEVWCHVFSFIDDFDDLIALKMVNQLFYQELHATDPLSLVDSAIKIPEEIRNHFKSCHTRRTLPTEDFFQAAGSKDSGTQMQVNVFRTVFLGSQHCGRTTFLHRVVHGDYKEDVEPTIGAGFCKATITDPNGVTSQMEIWETPGLERLAVLSTMYIRGAQSIFSSFGIDNRDSFVTAINCNLPQIFEVVRHFQPERQPVIYLLGLRSDLERKVPKGEAKALARVLNIKYFECSAKLNQNVKEVMEEMKDDLVKALRVNSIHRPSLPNRNTNQDRRCITQ